ncbi:1-acyl-sn-glycerol-3-phosphate acyltransferase [bacterium]|nr:1-acyl-sn-glycerol-3-phosphate acyltransferase [bacterium]
MIRAKHHPWAERIFRLYIDYLFRKNFNRIVLIGHVPTIDPALPMLLLPNHTTWWDGFFIYLLNREIFRRQIYMMMLEEQLRRYWFFSKIGCYSISPTSVRASLEYTQKILRSGSTLVCMYPQGELVSTHAPIIYKHGVEWICRGQRVQLIQTAMKIEYSHKPKPDVFIKLSNVLTNEAAAVKVSDLQNWHRELLQQLITGIISKNHERILFDDSFLKKD